MKRFFKSSKTWIKGLGNTLQFWDPKKVKKGVRQQWSHSADPLGNQLNKMLFPEANSASSYHAQNEYGIYGPTGSIVGRY